MRYLVTGGAGFIGSHLAEALLARGDHVTVLDDLSTGRISNLRAIKSHPRFEYVIESVANVPVTAELVDSADFVFHLAAAVGVRLIVESPVRTIETNVHGTEVVLGVAAIFLPGPGLLGIFAGLALLSQQYEWAERRVEPVRLRALLA